MVIGGESVPWWQSDHEYLDDIEMLEFGANGTGVQDGYSASAQFPDTISAAAGAVMGGEFHA